MCAPAGLAAPLSGASTSEAISTDDPHSIYSTSFFLSLVVKVTVAYITIALQQFEGFVLRADRQVCILSK